MNAALRSMFLLPILILISCGGGGQSSEEARVQREEARIKKEVDQRVTEIRSEMKVSEKRWHTARIVALCALAGGALIWLMSERSALNQTNAPEPSARIQNERTRVIERQDPYPENDEHDPRWR